MLREKKMLKIVTFKIEEELLERIDKIALRLGVPRSTIIRWAIQRWVAEFEGKKTETETEKGFVEAIEVQ